jgi:hypothetical protein
MAMINCLFTPALTFWGPARDHLFDEVNSGRRVSTGLLSDASR